MHFPPRGRSWSTRGSRSRAGALLVPPGCGLARSDAALPPANEINPCVLVFGDSVRGYGLALVALVVFVGAVGRIVARPDWQNFALAELAAWLAAQTDFRN